MKFKSEDVTVYGALMADVAITITKFVAATVTGSSSMFSEGIHSAVDASNTILLIVGLERSKKPADDLHNFGYGKEVYFWSLIVSMLLFSAGGGVSIYEGFLHLKQPKPLDSLLWNYTVLVIALFFDGASFWVAYKKFREDEKERNFFKAIHKSKDAPTITIVVGNLGAILGLTIAAMGNILSQVLHNSYWDGVASILVGVLLCAISVILVEECKNLLLGESISPAFKKAIKDITVVDKGVKDIGEIMSMYFGPKEILLTMVVGFKDGLSASEIQQSIFRIEKSITERFHSVKRIYVKAKLIHNE